MGKSIQHAGGGIASKAQLVERCHQLRAHVEARRLATEEEIAQYWPKRVSAGQWVWVRCYAQLVRFNGRSEQLGSSALHADAEEKALAALREAPVPVTLSDRSIVHVAPKSLDCLLWFRAYDHRLDYFGRQRDRLAASIRKGGLDRKLVQEPFGTIEKIDAAIAELLVTIAAQACAEGPSLDVTVAAEPPESFLSISPIDLLRIHRAFVEVNAGRLEAVRYLTKPRSAAKEDKPVSWSVLVGGTADRYRTDAVGLTKHHALITLLMQLHLSQSSDKDLEDALT